MITNIPQRLPFALKMVNVLFIIGGISAAIEIIVSLINSRIGGQSRLAGAPYFCFFTWLMLGTAVLFIPYALLYRERTWLQEGCRYRSAANGCSPPVEWRSGNPEWHSKIHGENASS